MTTIDGEACAGTWSASVCEVKVCAGFGGRLILLLYIVVSGSVLVPWRLPDCLAYLLLLLLSWSVSLLHLATRHGTPSQHDLLSCTVVPSTVSVSSVSV